MLLLLSLSTLNIDSRKELCPTDRFYLSLSVKCPNGQIYWHLGCSIADCSVDRLGLGGHCRRHSSVVVLPIIVPWWPISCRPPITDDDATVPALPLFSSLRFFVFGHGTRRRRRRLSFLPLLFFSLSCLRAPCRARAVGRLQQFPESEERNCGEKMKKVVKIKTASTGIESVSDLECFAVHNKGRIEFQVRDLWPGPLGPSSSVRRFGCGGIKAAACLHNGYRSKGPPPHTRGRPRARGGFL